MYVRTILKLLRIESATRLIRQPPPTASPACAPAPQTVANELFMRTARVESRSCRTDLGCLTVGSSQCRQATAVGRPGSYPLCPSML